MCHIREISPTHMRRTALVLQPAASQEQENTRNFSVERIFSLSPSNQNRSASSLVLSDFFPPDISFHRTYWQHFRSPWEGLIDKPFLLSAHKSLKSALAFYQMSWSVTPGVRRGRLRAPEMEWVHCSKRWIRQVQTSRSPVLPYKVHLSWLANLADKFTFSTENWLLSAAINIWSRVKSLG